MRYEAQEYASTSGSFVRRYLTLNYHDADNSVVTCLTRYSTEQSSGPVRVRTVPTSRLAEYQKALDRTMTSRGYFIVRYDADERCLGLTPEGLLRLYDERLTSDAATSLPLLASPTKSVPWVIRAGVHASARTSPVSRRYLELLNGVSHARDENRDLVITPATEQILAPYAVTFLGRHQANQSPEFLRQVLALYYPNHPAPQKLFSLSRLLESIN